MSASRPIALWCALVTLAGTATAENTSGVFGPVVREGDRSAQYRLGLDPDSDAWAQRFHVQQALDSRLRLRGILQLEGGNGSDTDLDYVQAELLWQLTPDGQDYQGAVRFDGRLRPGGEPELLRAIWTNQLAVTDKLRVRGIIVTGVELGDAAFDGVSLETRARMAYALDNGPEIGLDLFSAYGTTDELASTDDQEHQFGPYTGLDVGESWSVFGGVLFGLTDASPDVNLRLWLGRSF